MFHYNVLSIRTESITEISRVGFKKLLSPNSVKKNNKREKETITIRYSVGNGKILLQVIHLIIQNSRKGKTSVFCSTGYKSHRWKKYTLTIASKNILRKLN